MKAGITSSRYKCRQWIYTNTPLLAESTFREISSYLVTCGKDYSIRCFPKKVRRIPYSYLGTNNEYSLLSFLTTHIPLVHCYLYPVVMIFYPVYSALETSSHLSSCGPPTRTVHGYALTHIPVNTPLSPPTRLTFPSHLYCSLCLPAISSQYTALLVS